MRRGRGERTPTARRELCQVLASLLATAVSPVNTFAAASDTYDRSIKDACLEPLRLSVTEGAKVLGVTRHTLSRVINGRPGISPDMAIRLEKAGWSNADHWLRLQTAYELAQARKHQDQIQVERYQPRPAA